MSWTPPTAPTQPTTIGTNEGWALFLKVSAAYDGTLHDPPGSTNPDYITYWNSLNFNPNTILAQQVMQDAVEYSEKILVELGLTVNIWGEENDTKISELLVGANAAGLPGRASGAIVTPLGASWSGWFNVGGGAPAGGPRDLKGFQFDLTPWGPVTFTPAP